jgi:tetratricopeptide (TPR) repeat protein
MSGPDKLQPDADLDRGRRNFLIRSGKSLGAALGASAFARFPLHIPFTLGTPLPRGTNFQIHPRYRTARPLDALLIKARAGTDEFVTEKYSEDIEEILAKWAKSLLGNPHDKPLIASKLAADFRGGTLHPSSSTNLRKDTLLRIDRHAFSGDLGLDAAEFVGELQEILQTYERVVTAQMQVASITANESSHDALDLTTRVRYEMVASGSGFYREQRVGQWEMKWRSEPDNNGTPAYHIHSWRCMEETHSRSFQESFIDIADEVLGGNASFASQLSHGADYWRTTLDAASGIDIYGHNGVSVGDIDGDGYDDLYVCQGSGLPNRLYRNRRDGTFEDITESAGVGVLENTACALIVDVDNDGRQDLVVVCASGPQLFLNQGDGTFRKKPNAFQFAHAPRGTFTGVAVADYDRDGWLDIYFCLYVYYQGAEQYKYPLPYYDAENGPPNFLFRNNRDGTFRDVTEQSGLNAGNTRYSFCCAWSDYDGDGWPDLYVVNDFGRKNLYHNNGDGTFTDVSRRAGVEDTGAGMSACWFDFDNDTKEDLYVGDMWTAAGARVAMQPQFQPGAANEVRTQYQKHAMGNSLFRNRAAGTFDDATEAAGVGVGRWSWSSDVWDFDHDGFPDLYVTNGMVTGQSQDDLNSFFWRQVIAKSPLDARPTPRYEQGWNAINELIRADGTWSGYERNVFYANNRNGTFADVSGVLGLDFFEDGRSFALADFDHDGRLEVFLKNRNAPQLRVLKNVIPDLAPSIGFRLTGIKSNKDAIGAEITITVGSNRQKRSLQAGSGFLAQHSKDIVFGLGEWKGPVQASVLWPSGLVQELKDLPLNHRILVSEGLPPSRLDAFDVATQKHARTSTQFALESLPAVVETWLLTPLAAPDFSLVDTQGKVHTLSAFRGKPVLLNFWRSGCDNCRQALERLAEAHIRWKDQGASVLAVNLDDVPERGGWLDAFSKGQFPVLRGNAEVAAVYNIVFSYLFDRHRDLQVPLTFLLNGGLEIEKVYQGLLNLSRVKEDVQSLPRTAADRIAKALPFPGILEDAEFRRNYLSYGSIFFQRGYFEQAEAAFSRALADEPTSAEALYGLGSSALQLGKSAPSREIFERATRAQASYPDTLPNAWNNLGLLAAREGRLTEAVECFERALTLSPDHLVALDNLGNAYRTLKQWPDAQRVLQRAVQVGPDDAEANYSLAMVFAQLANNDRAYDYLRRALAIRPDYPEALNNLGILLLRTQRKEEAIRTFEQCIQVAPAFDQAYLNLARLYALQDESSRAKTVLQQLLAQHPNHEQARQMLDQLSR